MIKLARAAIDRLDAALVHLDPQHPGGVLHQLGRAEGLGQEEIGAALHAWAWHDRGSSRCDEWSAAIVRRRQGLQSPPPETAIFHPSLCRWRGVLWRMAGIHHSNTTLELDV